MKTDDYFEGHSKCKTKKDQRGCLKCKSFWIFIGLGVIASVFIGLAIFDLHFYKDNFYLLSDIIRFSIASVFLLFLAIGAYYMFRGYCLKGDGLDTLFGAVLCSIAFIALTMILIYFIPLAFNEAVTRGW